MKSIDPIVKGLGLTQHAWNKQGKHTWLPPSCSEVLRISTICNETATKLQRNRYLISTTWNKSQ